jgi:adenosylmethionine-8-amino-7-oxononanoate aminotransferase
MLYFVHYSGHLDQLETMRNIGDISQMSMLEMVSLMPGSETLQASQQEIANLAPEDYNENGVFTRLCTQFSWGSRYVPPFNHSSDALNCVAATLGKLGK